MKLRYKILTIFSLIVLFLAVRFAAYYYAFCESVGFSYHGTYDRQFVTYQKCCKKNFPVVMIHADHNIGPNKYSFLGKSLALKNYCVIVLQKKNNKKINSNQKESTALHQTLIKDSSDFNQELETRSKEILYDLEEEKRTNLNLDINNLILIGHGHGGDIMMKFASLYPEMVSKVISLDSRRYPFPRNPKLEILRFGAIDDEPNEGVVPSAGVQEIYVKGARHMDLCDRGSPEIKDEIQKSIIQFLEK